MVVAEAIDTARDQRRDALTGRIFESSLATLDVMAIYLGNKLGYYRALRGNRLTSTELANATGTVERYAREWLEQQAVTGILSASDETDGLARRYAIPTGHDEVLLEPESFSNLVPLAQAVAVMATKLPEIFECFRTGGGLGWAAFGQDLIDAQEGFNRAMFVNILGSEYLANIPAIHERLQANPPARVADIACGCGWSSIAIARAYPNVRVTGIDLDDASIAKARQNAAEAGLSDRVTFEVRDASAPGLAGSFDLVTIFEALHDVARPVEVLRSMRALVREGGTVLVMDEKVADTFTAPADPIERLMYGASVFCCLPGGLSEQPSAATGAVFRRSKVQEYAAAAGYRGVETLPLHHDCFRFYLLPV